ncbi:MAG: hypothetical protein ACTHWA_03435 [Arachnia sp.]
MSTQETMAPVIRAEFTSAGATRRLDAGGLSLIQYPGSEVEAGPHQVWLRRRSDAGVHSVLGLLGPGSGARVEVSDNVMVATGDHEGLEWVLWWDQPAEGVFGWGLQVTNMSSDPIDVDAVYTLDAALTPWETLRRNEFYVSQYLDLTPLGCGGDTMLAVRQNMPGPTTPWMALTCTRAVTGWCTDALQLAGGTAGTGLDLTSDLPSQRLQHEHTLAGLQCEPIHLVPGGHATVGFRMVVSEDHPAASSEDDVELVKGILASVTFRDAPLPSGDAGEVGASVFDPPSWLHGEDLCTEEFLGMAGEPATHVEVGPDSRPWAYSAGVRHFVASAKENAVRRPHGHILVASRGPGPQAEVAAVTVWMNGTIASQLTMGHADAQPLLTVRRSYLGLIQAQGVRLFVDVGDGWRLLGVPSAWAVEADAATWWWRWQGRTVVARSHITPAALTIEIAVDGDPLPLRMVAHTAGEFVRTSEGALQRASLNRGPDRVVQSSDSGRLDMRFPLADDAAESDVSLLAAAPRVAGADEIEALAEFLPWLMQDALIHYQVPRGLEQFTGGAWGTRDVCQGPVGMLIATGRLDLVGEVLINVFSAQQDDGNWPQWFEYLPDRRGPGHRESHGDVVYWPLLALAEHLAMTGDVSLLDVEVGWVGREKLVGPSPIRAHVRAALEHIMTHRARDPRLPAYGHGDWNDSLQPANPELARWMCSSWTAELEIKTLTTLAGALAQDDPELAARLCDTAIATEGGLREHLLKDDELAGYGIIDGHGVELLVHPRDRRTGLAHGSLQMIHAIADELLTPEEARAHVAIIDQHLDGPTGILLFDTPVTYHGGETHMFVRAEAASFWGREVGLMYTHAHLRWVEALLRLGDATRAWEALQLVIPARLGDMAPGAAPRQSNCYYSSIDACFSDRYDATDRNERLFDAASEVEGGWRVYSSGPGLVLRLVVQSFLGLRWFANELVIDPVLPSSLDGLCATVTLGGREVRVRFSVGGIGHGVESVSVNGVGLPTTPRPAHYRKGGVSVPHQVWREATGEGLIDLRIVVA